MRQDAGCPALAVPASEILGTQAMFNVLQGKYSVITSEFADLMLGYYGTARGAKDAGVVGKAASHQDKPVITCRPADLLEPSWDSTLRTEALALGSNGNDEDVLTYAMFPNAAAQLFQTRAAGPKRRTEASREMPGVPARAGSNCASASSRAGSIPSYIVRIQRRGTQSHGDAGAVREVQDQVSDF